MMQVTSESPHQDHAAGQSVQSESIVESKAGHIDCWADLVESIASVASNGPLCSGIAADVAAVNDQADMSNESVSFLPYPVTSSVSDSVQLQQTTMPPQASESDRSNRTEPEVTAPSTNESEQVMSQQIQQTPQQVDQVGGIGGASNTQAHQAQSQPQAQDVSIVSTQLLEDIFHFHYDGFALTDLPTVYLCARSSDRYRISSFIRLSDRESVFIVRPRCPRFHPYVRPYRL